MPRRCIGTARPPSREMLGRSMSLVLCMTMAKGFPKMMQRPCTGAAEQGDSWAQYNLGVKYDNGEGVPEDDAMAVHWRRKAAEQEDAQVQYNLGFMYDNGEGVPEDDALAVHWYRKAAEQGDADAQTKLGLMYAKGEGVPEDHVQAYAWLSVAAAQGHDNAQKANDIIAKVMTSAGIAEAQKLSREYLEAYVSNAEK